MIHVRAIVSAFLILLLTVPPLAAQNRAVVEKQFRGWLETEIWPAARRAGVSRSTFESALSGVSLNWDLPDLVSPGAEPQVPKRQTQAEFGAPARYFNPGSLDGATKTGRQMARRHAAILERIEQRSGVPGHVLLAIWGRESAFGRTPLRNNAFEVLGTKGFMSTRASYFTDELLALLKIAQAGHVPIHHLRSSWAGALGQPQFMPSSFLGFAMDGNGDGKADIWTSEADTLASIANYLARHGWEAGRDWGFEVKVPASVSCTQEGPDQGRPIREWQKMGVSRVSGRAFPEHEMQGMGYLLMPAGRNGPAFLVTPNFYVLKEYNMSDLYALFVGHLGDRIAFGMGDFSVDWGNVGALYRSDVAAMQRALESMGHDVGGADGLAGYKTRRSIGRWQTSIGQMPSCFPDVSMKATLLR